MPAVTAVTDPPDVTVALLLLKLQAPPVPEVVYNVVVPVQILVGPVMMPASGDGLTVNAFVAVAVPQLLVTV
jgi:hypothetical protein